PVNVGPRRHELVIDLFCIEPSEPLFDRFDQFGEEGAHLEAIFEVQCWSRRTIEQANTHLRPAVPDFGNQLGRHVMRMNIDGHRHKALQRSGPGTLSRSPDHYAQHQPTTVLCPILSARFLHSGLDPEGAWSTDAKLHV